jgi:hypothetical protein
MAIATKEIEAERAISQGDEELDELSSNLHATNIGDTSYHGVIGGKTAKDNLNNEAY